MTEGSGSGKDSRLRGMILAAGYGTRLAPVTDHVPKPLLALGGRPLLDLVIEGFDRAGIREIGVNTHHLGGLVTDHLEHRGDRQRFSLFPETEILGTGGALDGAREFLGAADKFLLHNGDVLCDADLSCLVADHDQSGALATLLLVDWPQVNSVTLAENGVIQSIAGKPFAPDRAGGRQLTYSGIGVFSARLLDDIGPGFSSLIDPLVRAISRDPECVRGHAPAGVRWSDLGTLFRYLQVQRDFPAPEAAQGAMTLDPITGHGSSRRFWRVKVSDWSAVAMVSPPEDEEFGRFTEIAEFLQEQELGAAAILATDPDHRTLLMEDLGPDSLFTLVKRHGWSAPQVTEAYGRTLDHLLKLQAVTKLAATNCPCSVDRSLDYEAFRWETDYFRERFLVGHLGFNPSDLKELDEEFHALAEVTAAQPRVLIHRDFQSQNIHPTTDRIGLVDFQGMRLGPLTYDLMSLLLDPYVVMPENFRTELVDRFAVVVVKDRTRSGDLSDIRDMALASGLQRIMQALGAFGFLGHNQGKISFLEYIPAGLATLREILDILAEAAIPADGAASKWRPGPMPILRKILDSVP